MRQQSSIKAVWWVSDVGYCVSKECLVTSDELFKMEATATDETITALVESEPPVFMAPIWLTINSDPATGSQIEHLSLSYDPMEETALHRVFAGCDLRRETAKEFADQFGFLGRRTEKLHRVDPDESELPGLAFWGESLDDWLAEMVKMRTLVRLWDLYRDSSEEAVKELREAVEIEDDSVFVSHPWVNAYIEQFTTYLDYEKDNGERGRVEVSHVEDFEDLEADIEELPPMADQDVRLRMATRILIRDVVNEALRVGSYASIDVKDGSPVYLIPRDLLGALYVHFAQELVGRSVPAIQCAACGSYFIPVHGRQRYCDDRCKFKGYRLRKKEKANG